MARLGWTRAAALAALCLLVRLGECSTDESSFSTNYGDCEEDTSSIADGICDAATNTAACGFDGGDCCECTCFVGGVLCDNTGAEFSCEDPDAPSDCGQTASPAANSTSSLEESECAGYLPHIQDGYCDEENNNAACGFDGGDCCACTCGEDLTHPCGVEGVGFDCQDPEVPSNCSLSLPGCGGDVDSIQNSFCDNSLNVEECAYDGGDCCHCTCREYGYYNYCGYYGYNCIDPNAPIDCDTDSPTPSPTVAGYPECDGYGIYLGNGVCETPANTLECGWDGGDCCRCTCITNYYSSWSCSYFDCLDPDAPTDCATESPAASPYASDDSFYASPLSPTPSPNLGWSDDSDVSEDSDEESDSDDDECQEPVWNISDGLCHASANNAACGWDGGDCCECTCVDGTYVCGQYGYNCWDPAGGEGCTEPTPAPASERGDLQDTPTTGTTISSADVGGVVTIAVFGFISVGGLIIGAFVFLRRKCEVGVQ